MPLKRCIAAPPPWPGACRAVPFAFVTRVPTQALRTVRRTIARVPGLRLAPVLPRAVRFVTMSYLMAQARRLPGPGGDRWLAHEANRTAHAWVLRHRDDEPRPWLICLHGFGTGTPFMDIPGFRARRLHRRFGLNLVFPTLPLHGHRRIGRISGEGFMSYDLI